MGRALLVLIDIYLEVYRVGLRFKNYLCTKIMCFEFVQTIFSSAQNFCWWLTDRNYVYNPTIGTRRELYFLPAKFDLAELKVKFPSGWNNLICVENDSSAERYTESSIVFISTIIASETDDKVTYLYKSADNDINDLSRRLKTFNKANSDFLHVCTFPKLNLDPVDGFVSNNVEYLCAVRMSYKANPTSYLSLKSNPWSLASIYAEYTHPGLIEPIYLNNIKQFLLPGNEILSKHFVRWVLKMSGRGSDFSSDYRVNFIILSATRYFTEFEVVSGYHLLVEEENFVVTKDNI